MDSTSPVIADVLIINKKGLHARATAKFVRCAEEFDASIIVTRDGQSAGGVSIMGLLTLAASPGTTIRIEATGPQAQPAVAALVALVSSRFGEDD